MAEKTNRLIIIIPAYNEEKKIGEMLDDLPKTITGLEIEFLVIDDGSTDRTAALARAQGAIVLQHTRNEGLGAAFATGINEALRRRADYVVNIDADRQFDPNEIPKLLEPILAGRADFVSGNRFSQDRPTNMPTIKYWGNKIMTALVNYLTKANFHDVSCGFRAYNREALLNLNLFGKFTYTQETFLDMKYKGLKIIEVPITVSYFSDRKSRVAKNLFVYAYNTIGIIMRSIINYEPLMFFLYPSSVCFLIGLLFIVFLLGHKLMYGIYTPYKAYGFIGAGFLVFGLLLLSLGVLAEIIDRIRINQEKILYYEKKRNNSSH